MKKFQFIGILLLLLSGCSNDATFDKPQPPDTKALSGFPSHIRGSYFSKNEISTLEIGPRLITQTYDLTEDVLPGHIDTTKYELSNDSLLYKLTGQRQKVIFSGDTLKIHTHGMDTMFAVSDTNVLKKFKGYYFLNKQTANKYWTVYRLTLSKGILTIGYIRDSTDIKLLKDIASDTKDSTGYHFKPSQKQFERFVKQNGFSEMDTFYRTNSR